MSDINRGNIQIIRDALDTANDRQWDGVENWVQPALEALTRIEQDDRDELIERLVDVLKEVVAMEHDYGEESYDMRKISEQILATLPTRFRK